MGRSASRSKNGPSESDGPNCGLESGMRSALFSGVVHLREDANGARNKILERLILALAALGSIALIPSVLASFEAGLGWLAAVDVVVYAWVIALHVFRHRLSYMTRVAQLLVLVGTLSTVLLLTLGLHGAGLLWLMAAPVLGSILLEARLAWITLGIVALGLAVLGVWIGADTLPFESIHGELVPLLWWVMAGNVVLVATALTATIQGVLHALERANQRLNEEKDARARLEADIRHAEQVAAAGAMAGGVAHDLNNLLQAILVPTASVLERLEQPELRDELGTALLAATGARDVTRRLLALARRGAPAQRERVLLDVRVADALELVRAAIPPPTQISATCDAPNVFVRLASGELEVLLVNLCLNAAQAFPRGTIRVATTAMPAGAVLSVSDDGPGIPEAIAAKVFEPFFTTRADGTGLGLATVHRVIESLGGRIGLRSSPGCGATFELHFPEANGGAPTDLPLPAESRPEGRLLLVDDDDIVRSAHRLALLRAGFSVITAATAEEGLARLDATVQVMVTDLRMPGLGGAELVRRALAERPDLRVVVCSGLMDPDLEQHLGALGVRRVLHKPVTLAELLVAVGRSPGPTVTVRSDPRTGSEA